MENVIFGLGALVLILGFIDRAAGGGPPCGSTTSLTYVGQTVQVSNIEYTANYATNKQCQQKITAPAGYFLTADCSIKIYQPTTGDCTTERFFVSRSGSTDPNFTGFAYWCGSGSVETQWSTGNAITIGYRSTSTGTYYAGTYVCTVKMVSESCSCGYFQNPKIVQGTQAYETEFPSYVGMAAANAIASEKKVICGGVMITLVWVLTAAHCVYVAPLNVPSNIELWAGKVSYSSNVPAILASAIRTHPSFNYQTSANDIALVQASKAFPYSSAVFPACLPSPALDIYNFDNNRRAVIAGFGDLDFGGPSSNVLRYAVTSTIPQSTCKSYWPNIDGTNICTFASGTQKDACQRDSGGPVYFQTSANKHICIGIIASGSACGVNKPGVNTRVAYYLSWINSVTGNNICTSRA